MTLDGLDEAFVDRLHRFLRLNRNLGWKPRDLDRVIAALAPTDGGGDPAITPGVPRLGREPDAPRRPPSGGASDGRRLVGDADRHPRLRRRSVDLTTGSSSARRSRRTRRPRRSGSPSRPVTSSRTRRRPLPTSWPRSSVRSGSTRKRSTPSSPRCPVIRRPPPRRCPSTSRPSRRSTGRLPWLGRSSFRCGTCSA